METRKGTAAKGWRLDVQDAEKPVDADAFLRRLADALLTVELEPEQEATNTNKRGGSIES